MYGHIVEIIWIKFAARIFLCVQAIAYVPKVVFRLITSKVNVTMFDVLEHYELLEFHDEEWEPTLYVMFVGPPLLLFSFLGYNRFVNEFQNVDFRNLHKIIFRLLYWFVKRHQKSKSEQMAPKHFGDITENPWNFIKPSNFQINNKSDENLIAMPPHSDYSTHL